MKNIIIFSTIKLYNGGSAGSARVTNYARALSKYCKVYLCEFKYVDNFEKEKFIEVEPNIFSLETEYVAGKIWVKIVYPFRMILFLRKVFNFSKSLPDKTVFLLYPSTYLFMEFVAVFYLKFFNKQKLYFEINEVVKYTAFVLQKVNLFNEPKLYIKVKSTKIISALSEKLTRFASGLICISTNIEDYFSKYNQNTIRIPILSDSSKVNSNIIPTYNEDEVFLIGFFGSLNIEKENLGVLLRGLNNLKIQNKKFRLNLYGNTTKRELEKLKNIKFGLHLEDQVKYRGVLTQSEVGKELKKHHLLILPRGFTLQNKYGFSTKLAEYLESGIPTLVTDVSDNRLFIEHEVNGYLIEPDNSQAFSKNIIKIMECYNSQAQIISKNATNTVKTKLDYRIYSSKLSEFLN